MNESEIIASAQKKKSDKHPKTNVFFNTDSTSTLYDQTKKFYRKY